MKRFCGCLLILSLAGCGVSRQIREAKTFAKCEFRLKSVNDLHLAGVNIQNVKSVSDLNLKKSTELMSALKGGKPLPLTFILNIQARNPNHEDMAAMNKLEWIIYMDEHEMVKGILDRQVQILPDSVAEFSLQVSSDLRRTLSGESRESMLGMAFNLAGEGNKPTHMLVKLKPSIVVAGVNLVYPGYLDVETTFTSAEGRKIMRNELEKTEENKK